MAFFRICPDCGAHLDPGEVCDCREIRERRAEEAKKLQKKVKMDKDGQYRLVV